MYFIWGGGGRGALPADNTPAQQNPPLNPPQLPPCFKFGSGGGGFKQDIQFPRTPPLPQRAQVSVGVGKPSMDSECASGCTTAWATARLRESQVVKQDTSSRGCFDTTKTRLGPQRVRMSSGERPIGAAKGKQPNTEALCQPPPPPSLRKIILPMHTPACTSQRSSRQTQRGLGACIWVHLVNGMGSSPSLGQLSPWSSQTGQVIQGLR